MTREPLFTQNVQSIFIPSSFQERQARANERNATDFMRFVVMPGMVRRRQVPEFLGEDPHFWILKS